MNLLYQYWIHTEAIRTLGPAEEVLNTPSHHRVHHGSNPSTSTATTAASSSSGTACSARSSARTSAVVYGLTKNIETFNPARIATHEHADILRDVAHSTTWPDRLSFVFRGPGWAYERHAARHEPLPAAGVS